jgi:phosphoribosylanthranilate isomerase
MISSEDKVLNMVHYHTKEKQTLAEQVFKIFTSAANHFIPHMSVLHMPGSAGIYNLGLCRALQMNVRFPPVEEVAKIKNRFPEMLIVFQANKGAMKNKTPMEFAQRTAEYGRSIDYVLIDPSGGKGQPFEIEHSVNMFRELNEKLPYLTIGFAGGFNGENVEAVVRELIQKTGTTEFCIDAEGGLRDKLSDAWGDDVLNFDKSGAYLQGAGKGFSAKKP